MAREIERIAAKGCHARSASRRRPTASGCPASGRGRLLGPGVRPRSATTTSRCACTSAARSACSTGRRRANIDHLIVLAPQLSAVIAADLCCAASSCGSPTLKVALSEGGIGWIPFFLDRMDRHVWNHRWTGLRSAEGRHAHRAVAEQLPRLLHHRPGRAPGPRPHRHRAPSRGSATTRTPTPPGRRSPEMVWKEFEGRRARATTTSTSITWQNAAASSASTRSPSIARDDRRRSPPCGPRHRRRTSARPRRPSTGGDGTRRMPPRNRARGQPNVMTRDGCSANTYRVTDRSSGKLSGSIP